MTKTEALSAAKNRLGISGTSDFDTLLEDFFVFAVNRFFPRVQQEVPAQTAVPDVDDYGETSITLSALATPVDDVRMVEARESTVWYPADDIYVHGDVLRVRGLSSAVSQLKIHGLKQYVIDDDEVPLPASYNQALVWYMMAEFYDYLGGNKSKYNIYAQSTGARAVDNMREEASFYEDKADQYIEERMQFYGRQ